ncbi:AAA family ATPase [Sagittula salina]|uniref:AAA family ATPase n=1 Tax=Sagittula salina TaxID=2820268 RepID=A0A940MKV1_9RHOB|nr:AAA family ATPase [Sagittula salina]MBP0481209.1 AAA family ATPase [Sagittula salina]
MRLRELTLDFFGHFTAHRYDFGPAPTPGASDFHIVYGPNEAGKTTTMEAALRLFYGFRHREPYDFQHQKKNLRVSGLIEVDGPPQCFARLPGRGSTLQDASGNALPEAALQGLIGMPETEYRALLCLDDETIETGGEDIANAKGDIGRLLFSAAAGIADLSTVLDQARTEASQLYKKRASTTDMARLKKELEDVREEIRAQDTSAAALKALKKALTEAQETEARARVARDALQARATEVTTLRRALPLLAERDSLAARLAAAQNVPAHISIDPEHLVRLGTDRARAQTDLDRLSQDLDEARTELETLEHVPEHLSLAERLAALASLRTRYLSAVPDLPKRQRTRDEALAAMAALARDLGAPEADPQALVLPLTDIAGLEAARDTLRSADSARAREAEEIETLSARLKDATATRDRIAGQAPITPVAELLTRHDADRLAPQYAAARSDVQRARMQLDTALATLAHGAVTFDTLPEAPLDLPAAEVLADRFTDLAERIARTTDDRTRHAEDAAAHAAQAERLSATGAISDTDARAALAERDVLWRAHRGALDAASAAAFEAALRKADDIAAARLAHARELGELRSMEAARTEAETRAAQAASRLAALTEERDALWAQAAEAATRAGLPPMPPPAFRDWLDRHAEAAAAVRALHKTEAQHAATLDRAARLLEALRPLLPLENPDLESALDAARKQVEFARAEAERLTAAEEDVRRLTEERDSRAERLAAATATAETARAAWHARVAECLDGAVAPQALDTSLDPLRRLREEDARRAQAQHQAESMIEDQRLLREALAPLATAHALTETQPLDQHAALNSLASKAAEAQQARERLETRCEALSVRLDTARDRLDAIDAETRSLAAQLPGAPETLDVLRAALSEAREVIAGRQRLADLDRTLMTDLDAPDLATARARLEAVSAGGLDTEAAGLSADLTRAETALTEAIAARAEAHTALRAITGDATIARLVERRTTLELQMEAVARDYLECDFGLRLAEEAIRRYRDNHRSGMMEATERAFSELTNGAYTRLMPRVENGVETLQVIDAAGTAKMAADLSKGTRFQLYLALRAAAYEQLVQQGRRLPFFCDDIFETFDEDRTRAACRLMERIGRQGQAIYLTHHRHVVDIARAVCEEAPKVHDIRGLE